MHDPIQTVYEVVRPTTPAPEPPTEETPTTDEAPKEEETQPTKSEPAPIPSTEEDVQLELTPRRTHRGRHRANQTSGTCRVKALTTIQHSYPRPYLDQA